MEIILLKMDRETAMILDLGRRTKLGMAEQGLRLFLIFLKETNGLYDYS